jgi:heme-degrading monooxygenase HmoA
MFVIRNVFKCKPGQAKNIIEKFKAAHALMSDLGFEERILVDEVADFWTVVVEVDVEDLAVFAKAMQERGSNSDVQAAMAGYMDMVESGYREIFRVA